MGTDEIMAVLETINEMELNQIRQTRAICYHIAASVGFADENGKPIKRTISEFWPLPGDGPEIQPISAEELEATEQLAIQLAEKLSTNGTKAI